VQTNIINGKETVSAEAMIAFAAPRLSLAHHSRADIS
jgi:hypothetical protein